MLQDQKHQRVNGKRYIINAAQTTHKIRLLALKNVICADHKYLGNATKPNILTCEAKRYNINAAQTTHKIRLLALKNVICADHKYHGNATNQKILTCEG